MHEVVTALGLMSGTSMDGIDVALVETDGERVLRRGPGMTRPYDGEERAALAAAVAAARDLDRRTARPALLAAAEARLTRAHAEAVDRYLQRYGIDAAQVAVLGFHGQTVLHRPERALTVQLGDGPLLAAATGIDVVWDFRAADVAAGGQGAPLVPVYHQALGRASDLELPAAVVNIGGVANVTWMGADGTLLAFDTGPGNALLDDWAMRHTGLAMDRDGALAAAGVVHASTLARLLADPYFDRPPPKSLDRGDFTCDAVAHLGPQDGAATLVAFTVEAIAGAALHFPNAPRQWVICGGGAHNPVLLAALRKRLGGEVRSADMLGWSAKFMEAEAFAFLAVRSLRGLPLTFPGTTGAPHPLTGGAHFAAPRRRRRSAI